MKKFLLVALGAMALGLSVPAGAADLAARSYTKAPALAAVYNWSGFYIGANAGGGSSHSCWNLLFPGGSIPEGCHDATGGTVGGQIGYRWQSASFVFGIEGQGNWADFSGSNATPVGGNPFGGLNDRTRIDAFGLITGQVGYAWNNVLAYVKGGAAVVDDKYDALIPGGGSFASANETRWGGTVGAGLEYGFAPNWSIGAEYNHIFLDSHDAALTDTFGGVSTVHVRQDVDMGLVRLNYRWGGPLIAKY